MLLEDAGHEVYEAPDGMPALKHLRTHPHGMVVLLDLNMPGMDGAAVLQAVIADAPLVMRHRFILFTAQSSPLPAALVSLLDELAVPILSKLTDSDVLLAAVEKVAESIA